MLGFFRRRKKESLFTRGVYPLMREGFPPEDLTWEQAFEIWKGRMTPMMIERLPAHCPTCEADMLKGEHDWWDIEGGGQYMVRSAACPNGHGYALDVA